MRGLGIGSSRFPLSGLASPQSVVWMRDAALARWAVCHGGSVSPGLHQVGVADGTSAPSWRLRVVAIAPHDLHAALYPGGAFLLSTFLEGWSFKVVKQVEGSLRRTIEMATSRSRVKRALTDFPLADAGERLLRDRGMWYREWVTHRDVDDPLWARSTMTEALERVQVPILLQGG
jgi:X-Pro dipeptidyl-peptidase (S15 family)